MTSREVDSTEDRVILIQHVRQGSDLEYIVEDICQLNDHCHGGLTSGTEYQEKVFRQWLSGEFPVPLRPWAVCIRLVRERWMFLAGPFVSDELLRRIGTKKQLRTIVAGFDAGKSKSYFRSYGEGKIEIDFHAIGAVDEPPSKIRFKGPPSVESMVHQAGSPAKAVDALFEHYGAQRMRLRVVEKDSCLQIRSHNAQELPFKKLKDLDVLDSYSLIPGDNPASDLLAKAIEQGDQGKFDAAMQAGASLQDFPFGGTPLSRLLISQKGDWKAWARTLVQAGAPVDGIPGDRPTWWEVGMVLHMFEDWWVEAIDLLVELGARLDLQDRSPQGDGQTVLHFAVAHTNQIVVQSLIAHGAHVDIADDKGNTPLSIARRNMEYSRGAAKQRSEHIVQLLEDARAHKLDMAKLKESTGNDLARLKQQASQVQTAKEDSYWTNLAQLVIDLPDTTAVSAVSRTDVPREATRLEKQLVDSGFARIGTFHFSGASEYDAIAYHHGTKHLYGTIIIFCGQAFLSLSRFDNDGTIWNVSNASLSYDFSARVGDEPDLPVRHHVVDQASLDQLLEQLDAIRVPPAGVVAIRPGEYIDRLQQMHDLDSQGHRRAAEKILGVRSESSSVIPQG